MASKRYSRTPHKPLSPSDLSALGGIGALPPLLEHYLLHSNIDRCGLSQKSRQYLLQLLLISTTKIMRPITTRGLPSHRQWRLLAGCAVLPCSLAAEAITDTVTFSQGMMPFLTTYVTGDLAPLAVNFVFEPGAALDQALLVNTPNVAVTAGIGSSISAPSTMNFALQFQNTGGSLNANGMSLTSRNNSGTSRGALVFTQAGTAVLNNSTITALANSTSAALFEAGGSLTMTGGSLNYSPASAAGFEGYAL